MMMGGYIVKRFNLKLHGIFNFNIACNAIVFLSTTAFLVRCDPIKLAGVINSYDGTEITSKSVSVAHSSLIQFCTCINVASLEDLLTEFKRT